MKESKYPSTNAKKKVNKGSMNINELWSEKQLADILGPLPFPRDRTKVLKMYPRGRKNLALRKRTITETL